MVDWSQHYVVSKALMIQIDPSSELVATNSVSRRPVPLGEASLAVLRGFAEPTTVEAVYAGLDGAHALSEEGLTEVVANLAEANLITPVRGDYRDRGTYGEATGLFASPIAQHLMLRDSVRVMAYRAAIFQHAAGKTVVDLGCGSGILSIFAAQAGAERVYAIEESAIAGLAQQMFAANGVGDRVSLLIGNSKDLALSERADVIVHEILGVDPFFENLVPYIADAKERFLVPEGGRLIPHRIDVCCVGLEPDFVPSVATRAYYEAKEMSAAYGVDMEAYARLIRGSTGMINEWSQWPHQRDDPSMALFTEKILSQEVVLRSVDLYSDLSAIDERVEVTLPIAHDGHLGSLLLYFRAHLDERLGLTTSPFAPRTHWGWSVRDLSRSFRVRAGDEVALACWLELDRGKQKLGVDLAPAG